MDLGLAKAFVLIGFLKVKNKTYFQLAKVNQSLMISRNS